MDNPHELCFSVVDRYVYVLLFVLFFDLHIFVTCK